MAIHENNNFKLCTKTLFQYIVECVLLSLIPYVSCLLINWILPGQYKYFQIFLLFLNPCHGKVLSNSESRDTPFRKLILPFVTNRHFKGLNQQTHAATKTKYFQRDYVKHDVFCMAQRPFGNCHRKKSLFIIFLLISMHRNSLENSHLLRVFSGQI